MNEFENDPRNPINDPMIEYKEVEVFDYDDIDNVEVEGIMPSDYPDFVDAFISSADYRGEPMTEKQLETLNEDSDFVYNAVLNSIN
jgi:hypothetical protein